MSKDFNFFVPVQIEKSTNERGEEERILGGVASTEDIDADEQFMSPKGFDTKPLMDFGWINWNHLSKHSPAAIIGEPLDARVEKNKFHIKAKLFDSPLAKDAYDLVKTLEKSGSKRKLGWSIEGKVLETDPLDPRKVLKASITGVALTPSPKNPHTFASIMKGDFDHDEYEYEIEKAQSPNGGDVEYVVDVCTDGYRATVDKGGNIKIEKMDTDAVDPLTKESLEGARKVGSKIKKLDVFEKDLSKAQVYQYIFENFEADINKAKEIYNLFLNVERSISNNMSKETISQDAIQKAREILNLAVGSKDETVEKGSHMSVDETTNGGAQTVLSKAIEFAKACMSEGKSKDEYKKEAMQKGYDEDTVEKAYAEVATDTVSKAEEPEIQKAKDEGEIVNTVKTDDTILKAISDLSTSINTRFGAVGTLIGAQTQGAEEIQKSISDLQARIDKVELASQGRKAVGAVSYVERFDNEVKKAGTEGKKVLNINDYHQRQELATKMLEKANDTSNPLNIQYGQAIIGLESQAVLSQAVQADLMKDGIMVVRQ